jgi:hypothetical protein
VQDDWFSDVDSVASADGDVFGDTDFVNDTIVDWAATDPSPFECGFPLDNDEICARQRLPGSWEASLVVCLLFFVFYCLFACAGGGWCKVNTLDGQFTELLPSRKGCRLTRFPVLVCFGCLFIALVVCLFACLLVCFLIHCFDIPIILESANCNLLCHATYCVTFPFCHWFRPSTVRSRSLCCTALLKCTRLCTGPFLFLCTGKYKYNYIFICIIIFIYICLF